MKAKITINGQVLDLENVTEAAAAQAALVPPNWKHAKKEAVRLFIATQEMIAFQLRRHLAHNWKKITEVAINQQERGEGARVGISFAFEVDQTAPTVAALTKIQMSFSEKFVSKGKPTTQDITQGDLFEDTGVVVDAGIAEEEAEEKRVKDEAEAEKARLATEKTEAKEEKAAAKEAAKSDEPKAEKPKKARSHHKKKH